MTGGERIDQFFWITARGKSLSRQMMGLSFSNAGRYYPEARKQTKCNGPNNPFQHWLVGQKWYQGAGQEIDRPDYNRS